MHQMLTFWDPTLSRGVLPSIRKLNPEVSREMENLIKNATNENPGQRYPNIKAFLKDLRELMKIRPQSGRKKETGWLSRLAKEFSKPFKKDADE
jgi:hypothetical protein